MGGHGAAIGAGPGGGRRPVLGSGDQRDAGVTEVQEVLEGHAGGRGVPGVPGRIGVVVLEGGGDAYQLWPKQARNRIRDRDRVLGVRQ